MNLREEERSCTCNNDTIPVHLPIMNIRSHVPFFHRSSTNFGPQCLLSVSEPCSISSLALFDFSFYKADFTRCSAVLKPFWPSTSSVTTFATCFNPRERAVPDQGCCFLVTWCVQDATCNEEVMTMEAMAILKLLFL